MKAVIYNDCNFPAKRHFGCQLVMETFREQLNRVGIELVGTVSYKDLRGGIKKHHRVILDKADLVIVNGEGSFHHNARNDLAHVSKLYPSVLINTVFQQNDVDLSSFLYTSARESLSAAQMRSCGAESVEVVPDIIFTSNRLGRFCEVRMKGTGTAKILHGRRDVPDIHTLQSAETFLEEFNRYEKFITVSFHGAIVCILTNSPFCALEGAGRTHKNEGLCRDIGLPEAYLRSDSTPVHFQLGEYVEKAQRTIDLMFERMHGIYSSRQT